MCFSQTKPKIPDAPPVPAGPVRADEEIKRSTNDQLDELRRRQGRAATIVTGGLGDTGFGQSVTKKTLLGQ